jgi:hypothetical protein
MRSFADSTETGLFDRLAPLTPSASDLRAYAGDYASSELGVTWTIVQRGSSLAISRLGRPDTVVEPVTKDTFTTIGDYMTFLRAEGGAVTGFRLVSSGIRDLRFERVNR